MPIDSLTPDVLRIKVYEPLLLLGKGKETESGKWGNLDFKIRVKGGGYVSQIYAVRQAIARGIIAFNQKYVDEATKKDIRDTLSSEGGRRDRGGRRPPSPPPPRPRPRR